MTIRPKLGIIMKTIKKSIVFTVKVFFATLAINIFFVIVYLGIMFINGTIPTN